MEHEKPYRVVSPHKISWVARFTSEEAAWKRILSANGRLSDTRVNRTTLIKAGWAVKLTEPAANDLGGGSDPV